MGELVPLIVLGVVAAVFLWAMRPRPVFVLEVRNGMARVVAGHVRPEFVSDCEMICQDAQVDMVRIKGLRRREGVGLAFGRGLSPALQQRFRNAYHFHGR